MSQWSFPPPPPVKLSLQKFSPQILIFLYAALLEMKSEHNIFELRHSKLIFVLTKIELI
jgi:hypothetical protein